MDVSAANTPKCSPLSKPITLGDLTEDLLWPHLFRAVPLALRPDRLGLAFFMLLIVRLLARLMAPASEGPASVESLVTSTSRAFGMADWRAAATGGVAWLLGVPWGAVTEHPWRGVAVGLPVVLVLVLGLGAISRMAACEFSQSVMLPWTRGLAFALSRWASLAVAILGPLAVAAGFLLVVALVGGAFFNWSISAVAGGILYPVLLIVGGLAALTLAGYAFGHALLIPAVACEGTDSIDAVQRAYAYAVGRPIRLIAYQAVLYLVLGFAALVFSKIAWWVTGLTAKAAGFLAGGDAAIVLSGSGQTPAGAWELTAKLIALWSTIPHMLVGAFLLSCGATGSTILYLLLRKLNDGQDFSEIWMPGMVGGTLAAEQGLESDRASSTGESDDDE